MGVFLGDPLRKPGWSTTAHVYYGNGEGFVFECVARDNSQDVSIRICESTLRNQHFICTLPDALIFGGSGGEPLPTDKAQGIALMLTDEFARGWSEGGCPTYDMGGIPLGAPRDAHGVLKGAPGVLDLKENGWGYTFKIADVEVYGLGVKW